MKVCTVGGDARSNAIFKLLHGEGNQVLAAMEGVMNPYMLRFADKCILYESPIELAREIQKYNADFVVIGPEKSLDQRLADILAKMGILVVGPRYIPAQIELDKAWMIRLLIKNGLAKWIPASKIFKGGEQINNAWKFIDELGEVVVKPAGLTGGKGVRVMGDQLHGKEEARAYVAELLMSGQTVIIQKKETGTEFSDQGFVDKYGFIYFVPLVMDFKKLFDGIVRVNPNTGSMAAVNGINGLVPGINKFVRSKANDMMRRIVQAIEEETGIPYIGFIYGQFMLTKDGCLVLIEINARLGDPEAINVLSLLSPKTRFTDICLGIVNGNLADMNIKFENGPGVVKYVVPKGYALEKNPQVVELAMQEVDLPIQIFCGGVRRTPEGALLTTGSRAVAVWAGGRYYRNIEEAAGVVNRAIPQIFEGCIEQLHWRPGIGFNLEEPILL